MNRIVFAAAAAALSTAALFAAPQVFAEDMKLTWSDLNLSTPDAQKMLDRRINKIATAMCADQIQTGTRLNGPERCRSDLKASLAAQVAATNKRLAIRN
jgi:UrcA family protein